MVRKGAHLYTMTTITKATAHATPEGWPVLMVEWEGGPGAQQVVQGAPVIWRNGLVSIDDFDGALGLPTLDALQVPGDETSGTLTVDNALNAPQAAAIALEVFGGADLPEEPVSIVIPTMELALEVLAGK